MIRSSVAKRLMNESPLPKMTDGWKMVHLKSGPPSSRTMRSASPLERR